MPTRAHSRLVGLAKYRNKGESIMAKTVQIHGETIQLSDTMITDMEENRIMPARVEHRVEDQGWSLEDACRIPKGVSRARFKEQQAIRNHQTKRNQHALDRKKQQRPWLFDGTPQHHSRGEWCKYLMQHDIFPKTKRDEANV